jgi:DNA-binding transcriptional MerR regulator
MMSKKVLMQHEFANKVRIPEKTLEEWQKCGLIKPVGFTEDKIPLYSEVAVEKVNQIQKFQAMGYELEEIQKIFKKVGLPKTLQSNAERTSKNQFLTVGNLADRVGVSTRTIKHWEDKGIIVPDTRSEGGFRLYSEVYIYLCKLIKDLQLFGYSLEEIKTISDYFREFLTIQKDLHHYSQEEVDQKCNTMLQEIQVLFDTMRSLKEGIHRWEDLLKKKKRELISLKSQNEKQSKTKKESSNA